MANNKINLKKSVISNQKAQELYDGAFNEVILSPEKIDDEKLKKIYEDLFYQISKNGKSSHEEIIIKSDNVVNPETNINYDSQIKELEQTLLEKNEELLKSELPPNEHPLFSNNTFIQVGDANLDIVEGNDIYFTQNGFKRYVSSMFLVNIIRKSLGENLHRSDNTAIPLNQSINYQLASADEINQILEAQDITGGAQLSIPLNELIAKENQTYIYSQLKVEFECFGVEKYYKFDEEEKQTFPNDEGYWYKDTNASCEITYQTDIDPSTSFEPQINTITISKYGTRTISRDPSLYGGRNPLESSIYEEAATAGTYELLRQPDVFSTYYPAVRAVKNFGEGKAFPAVIDIPVGHRVKAKILSPTNSDGSPLYEREGSPGVSEWIMLNGIDTRALGNGTDDIFKFFNDTSNSGYRMINNFCYGPVECFGKLNNAIVPPVIDGNDTSTFRFQVFQKLQNLFKDKNSRYYKRSKRSEEYGTWITGKWRVEGGVYGQPILLVKSKLAVFLGCHRQNLTDWNVFYNLENGGTIKISNGALSTKVEGYKRDSKRFFNWIRKGDDNRYNNPDLYFPGLKGVPINYTDTDLDQDPDYTGLEQTLMEGSGALADYFIENQIDPTIENIPGSGGEIPTLTDLFNMIGDKEQIEDNIFNPSTIGSDYDLFTFNDTLKFFNKD